MDLTTNSTVQTQPEPGSETPTRIHPPPPLTNGVLKRHAPLSLHPPLVVSYKECLRNHAATIGGHAVDGCGEFMPSPSSNPSDQTGLRCAACGCHRNFHRREPEETTPPHTLPLPLPLPAPLEYRPNHRHHPPPPPHGGAGDSGNNSPSSPPPISSSYYPAAPHVLLALGHAPDGNPQINYHSSGGGNHNSTLPPPLSASNGSRKRFRTKFTQNQKDKMQEFAERVGWRMQKRDEDLINEFCAEIGVDRTVFKVWMHNNKNPSGKKDPLSTTSPPPPPPPLPAINGNGMSYSAAVEEHFRVGPDEGDSCHDHHHVMGTNGSSSSC